MKLVKLSKKKVKNLDVMEKYNFDSRYVANEYGKVFLIKQELMEHYKCKPINPYTNRHGYVEYVLTTKLGIKKHIQEHTISAWLWIRKPKINEEVNHKEGNKKDNYYKKLSYMSHSENIKHSYDELKRKPWGSSRN